MFGFQLEIKALDTITFHADLFGKKVSAEYVCYSYWHFSRPPWAKSENDYNHGKRTPRTLYIYIDEKKVYRWKNPEIYEIYNKFFCGKK